MKFELALFDLGGTLISFENNPWDELGMQGCTNGSVYLKETTGVEVAPEILWKKLYDSIENMIAAPTQNLIEVDLKKMVAETIKSLGVDVTDGIPAKFIEAYYKPITEQVTLIDGSVEILTKMKKAGMTIGLVSNTVFPPQYHLDEMERFGILEFFDYTLFSADLGIRKPNKDIYKKALDMGGADADKAIFIGDRLIEDVGGPQSIGIKAVLKYIERRGYTDDIKPYKTIDELHELESIVF